MGIILFAVVLSALVVFHEWGHYYAAKCFGIRVERFSIGFGQILARFRPKETEFCISLIPLGGYVQLSGESAENATGETWEFHGRPRWQKIIVVVAGPLLNALLAFLLFAITMIGGQPSLNTRIGEVMPSFPAATAGIKAGDRIVSVNGQTVQLWGDLLVQIHENKGQELNLGIDREGKVIQIPVAPKISESTDIFGRKRAVPMIGVTPAGEMASIRMNLGEAIVGAFKKVVELSKMIMISLWMVVTGALSFKESLAGPIGIYMMTQQAAQIGFLSLLDFMGRLSVSLFIINLFPLPVLDGGHLLFLVIESIIRRPISEKFKEFAMRVGFVLIIALTVFVIYQDVLNFGIWDKILNLIRR